MVIEIGERQGERARAAAVAAGYERVDVRPDFAGADRALVAFRPN